MKITSATPAISSVQNNTNKQKVAFKGLMSDLVNPKKLFSLERQGTMCRSLFVLNAFVFLLGSRLVTSRDKKNENQKPNGVIDFLCKKNEIRETLLRDVPSIVIAVFGVPEITKFVSKLMQKKTGLAILKHDSENKGKFKEISYGELKDLYTYDANLDNSSGLKGFSRRLAGINDQVNLKNIYSRLTDSIKQQLSGFTGNNEALIDKLSENTTESKKLAEEIKNALKDVENKAFKNAENMKTSTKLFSFLATLSILGICIPELNIFTTAKVNKRKAKQEKAAKKCD